MTAIQVIFGIILIVFSIAIIFIVIMQQGNQQNVGAISGGADTFFAKNKARSIDAFLAKWTKFIAIGFFLVVIIVNAIMYFAK